MDGWCLVGDGSVCLLIVVGYALIGFACRNGCLCLSM